MEKYKPAIIAGGCAFVLSLLVALASGVGFPALLLRPLIFGAGFFLFGLGATLLFRRFLVADVKEAGLGSNVDISVDDEDDMEMRGFVFGQDEEGLEQNSAIDYTGDGEGIDASFKPMDFKILNENVDANVDRPEMPRSVDPSFAENREMYARVPEADSVANADPKKLAGTIQNLLLDDE